MDAGNLQSVRPHHGYILKIRILRNLLCLLQQRFVTSCLYDPPLVEGQGAEAAAAKAAPVTDEAELHLTDGRNAPRAS